MQTRKFLITTVAQSSGNTDLSVNMKPESSSVKNSGSQLKTYPNPFTSELNIEINSTETTKALLRVFDVHGKIVSTLIAGNFNKGEVNKFKFEAEDLASGLYVIRLSTPSSTIFQKVILCK